MHLYSFGIAMLIVLGVMFVLVAVSKDIEQERQAAKKPHKVAEKPSKKR